MQDVQSHHLAVEDSQNAVQTPIKLKDKKKKKSKTGEDFVTTTTTPIIFDIPEVFICLKFLSTTNSNLWLILTIVYCVLLIRVVKDFLDTSLFLNTIIPVGSHYYSV